MNEGPTTPIDIVDFSLQETQSGNIDITSPDTPKHDFETSSLFKNVYAFVEDYMSRYDCSHDFNHILRVLNLAKHILSEELKLYPAKKFHKQAILLAALLHDVGDKKYIIPGENAEQMVSDLLSKNGCPPRFVAKVALIVENVSYTNETKRPQFVKAIIGAHPELAVVQDADRLDAIGAVGIGRVFAFGAVKDKGRGLTGSIEHFEEKLEKIEGMMKTETGRLLARERTKRLREFRGWWEEETNLAAPLV
ncbi:related to HD superfamily hydrolase [Ramularia collo-cygni]|uniref:Related to HD superfamily hydrolase n=1 Tax=Ramularia collo-cygni TaxID=112498 RepID=A0A2D3VDP5_9PEZI|nr:related to HD superfamily hydrolase [Ramularia collo-cygni]CZT18703.1 related to HD superfamily hydrolase [Ramularia collo-cygni]